MADILDTAVIYRRAIEKADAETLRRVVAAYRAVYGRLQGDIEAFVDILEAGKPLTEAQIVRLDRYQRLLRDTEREMRQFGEYLSVELSASARTALTLGEAHARGLIAASTGIVATQFQTLNPAVIEQLVGFLDPKGNLFKSLTESLPLWTRQNVADAIIGSVGVGKSPVELARVLRKAYGYSLESSLTTARTVQLYAYREASRASYLANSDVVGGWIWMSALTPTTCMACVRMHGTWHPNTERLNDHHRGYCQAVPAIGNQKELEFSGENWKNAQGKRHAAGWGNTTIDGTYKSGEEWFGKLPEAQQRRMMGDTRYEAWRDGKFSFDRLATEREDSVYGNMKAVTPLRDLLK